MPSNRKWDVPGAPDLDPPNIPKPPDPLEQPQVRSGSRFDPAHRELDEAGDPYPEDDPNKYRGDYEGSRRDTVTPNRAPDSRGRDRNRNPSRRRAALARDDRSRTRPPKAKKNREVDRQRTQPVGRGTPLDAKPIPSESGGQYHPAYPPQGRGAVTLSGAAERERGRDSGGRSGFGGAINRAVSGATQRAKDNMAENVAKGKGQGGRRRGSGRVEEDGHSIDPVRAKARGGKVQGDRPMPTPDDMRNVESMNANGQHMGARKRR